MFNLKKTCKGLKEVSEQHPIYKVANVLDKVGTWIMREEETFMATCYKHRNLGAIYLNGVQNYFKYERLEEGLAGIKLEADPGCEIALYAYTMIHK